jgi:hypothetical protein
MAEWIPKQLHWLSRRRSTRNNDNADECFAGFVGEESEQKIPKKKSLVKVNFDNRGRRGPGLKS